LRLNITARHAELSEEVKALAREKVGRLEKYSDRVTQAQLVLCPDFVARRGEGAPVPDDEEPAGRSERSDDVSGRVATAELVMAVPRERSPLVVHARGESFQAAIDLAVDKMERRLRKYKEKLKDRRHPR
jgi:ribosomal subunit interface protein